MENSSSDGARNGAMEELRSSSLWLSQLWQTVCRTSSSSCYFQEVCDPNLRWNQPIGQPTTHSPLAPTAHLSVSQSPPHHWCCSPNRAVTETRRIIPLSNCLGSLLSRSLSRRSSYLQIGRCSQEWLVVSSHAKTMNVRLDHNHPQHMETYRSHVPVTTNQMKTR